jgi:hypothetical protein
VSLVVVPPVISQVTYAGAGDVDDCWVVSTVWAALAADRYAIQPSVPAFRALAGLPDRPGPTGGTLDHVMRGARRAWPHLNVVKYASTDWSLFERRLREGWSASLGVLSSALPVALRFGFQGAHQVGVVYSSGRWLVANPLARSGSAPLVCPLANLQAAARKHGGGTILAALFEPWEGSVAVMFDPTGNDPIGASTVQRDTQLIRLDGARIPIAAGTERNVYLSVGLPDGRRAWLVTYKGSGHLLVDDDRQRFVAAKRPSGDVKRTVTVTVSDGRKPVVLEV